MATGFWMGVSLSPLSKGPCPDKTRKSTVKSMHGKWRKNVKCESDGQLWLTLWYSAPGARVFRLVSNMNEWKIDYFFTVVRMNVFQKNWLFLKEWKNVSGAQRLAYKNRLINNKIPNLRTNEWTNERLKERINEWTSNWMEVTATQISINMWVKRVSVVTGGGVNKLEMIAYL